MSSEFVKFPRTPHLFWLGESPPRGDKLVSEQEAAELLKRPVIVEEKVDGACLGLSIGADGRLRAQSRGSFLSPGGHAQFAPLWRWLAARGDALAPLLDGERILFGEWCYARHTVAYDALPDWFVAFDVYDPSERCYWSVERRDALVATAGLTPVPLVAKGLFDRAALGTLMTRSHIGSCPMEGIYLRWEDGHRLVARAKVVRPGWVPPDEEHWSRRPVVPNRLAGAIAGTARAAGDKA